MIAVLHRWLPLLLLLMLAGSARASCGDYLHVGGAKDEPSKPAPAKPCDGPHCTRHQTPPAAPTPVSPTSVTDDLGCVVNHTGDAIEPRAGWLDLIDAHVGRAFATSVFHPPR
jgi:hypothetical protein